MRDERIITGGLPISIKENSPPSQDEMSEAQKIKNGICPSCSGSLVFQEGCKMCYSCGWGGCS